MKNNFLLPILWVFAASLTGCELLLFPEKSTADPVAVFEETWAFADRTYSFFEYKNIDWDAVHDRYRPLINADMTEVELFEVLADMLFELRDGHVNVSAPFDRSRNWTWFLNSPANFNYDLLERNYFQSKQRFVGPFVYFDFGDVAYVRYSSFSNGFTSEQMDFVINAANARKGLIIDMRDNGGGSLGNAFAIANRFSDNEVVALREQSKNGPGHEDFTALEDRKITPADGPKFLKPVVLLTNRSCYSATNFFATMMLALPQVTSLGDTTGGGGGAPAFTELSNGWILRVSSTRTFTPDGFNVESGVAPDVHQDLTPEDEANGVDSMVEKALEILRQ